MQWQYSYAMIKDPNGEWCVSFSWDFDQHADTAVRVSVADLTGRNANNDFHIPMTDQTFPASNVHRERWMTRDMARQCWNTLVMFGGYQTIYSKVKNQEAVNV